MVINPGCETRMKMMLRTPPPRPRSTPKDSQSPDCRASYSLQRRLWEQSNMSTPYHHTINAPSPPKRSRLLFDEEVDPSPVIATVPVSSQQVVAYDSTLHTVSQTVLGEQEEYQPVDWDDGRRCSYKCTNMVKSELLEALETTSEQVLQLESASKSYKTQLDVSESQRKQLKLEIASLEQAVAAAAAREKSLQSQRLAEADKAAEIYRQQLMRCCELQGRLQEEIKLKAEAEIAATAAEARAVDAEVARDKLERTAEREQNRLKEQLLRMKEDSESTISRLKAEKQLEKGRVQSAMAERRMLETRVDDLQTRLAECFDVKRETELKLLAATAQTCTTRTTRASEAESVIKHLRDELNQNSADVLEAKRLRQEHTNVELLKEKLESERDRANKAESALCQIVDMEVQIAALEAELHAWKETINQIPGVSTLEDVLPKFAQLQTVILAETARTGEVSAQLVELRTALESAEAAKQEAHAKAESALQEVANMGVNLKRMERKMTLLGKERDGLKAILASYDEEEAVIVSHQKPGSGIADLTTPENVKQTRIKELEVALESAKRHAEVLEESLDVTSKELKTALVRAEFLSKELKDAEGKIKSLENKEDLLRSELAVAESKIGRGDFNPATTKVVHMIDNLKLGTAENQLKLHAEIATLKSKLEGFEQRSCSSEPSNLSGSSQNQENVVAKLTQRVASLEKREARYRQVFADKIAAFREACYLLFGYTVKMTEQQDLSGLTVTLLSLHSKYAQRDEERLEFQYTPGSVNMIENEYSSSSELAPQVNIFIRKWNCIPAFIANLTIESFNKVTMG